jgi:hypothetical protein
MLVAIWIEYITLHPISLIYIWILYPSTPRTLSWSLPFKFVTKSFTALLREQNISLQNITAFTKLYTPSCIILQVLFQRVTGSPLTLSLRRTGLLHCAIALLITAVAVGLQIYKPYWPMWRMLSTYAVILQLTACTTFRMMTFSALQITSSKLVRRFRVINKISVIFVLN